MLTVKKLYKVLDELLREDPDYGELSVAACGANGCFRVIRNAPEGKVTGLSVEDYDYMESFYEMAEDLTYEMGVSLSDKDMQYLVELCVHEAPEEELVEFIEEHKIDEKRQEHEDVSHEQAVEQVSKDVDHLAAFIEVEVPFRIKEILKLENVSDDEISDLIDVVKDNTDVMFDYNRFDEFLEDQLREIRGIELDHKEINSIKAELGVLRHDINGCAEFAPDLLPAKELRQAILELRLGAAMQGAHLDLDEDDVVDLEHLDSFWYSGVIGCLAYKGYEVLMKAYGDINISVLDDKNNIILEFSNRHNEDPCRNDKVLAVIPNDKALLELSKNGNLVWENNNWLEFDIRDSKGRVVTPGNVNTLIECDNILEAFTDVQYFTNIIDGLVNEKTLDNIISGCEVVSKGTKDIGKTNKMDEVSL